MSANSLNVAVFAEQLCRTPSGGIGVYATQLARALTKLDGVRSEFLASRGATQIPEVTLRQIPLPHRLTVELLYRGAPLPGWAQAAKNADVVHATSFDLPPKDSRPLTVFVHDVLWRPWPQAYSKRGFAWHEKGLERSIERAAKLLVPSTAVRDDLIAAGAGAAQVVVVSEGCDHLPMHQRFDGGYFLSVGTHQPRKNLPGLLAGYSRYREQSAKYGSEPLRLKIVGPQGWGPELGSLPHGVDVVGSVSDDELARLYSGAIAFVLVPFAEGFGLPVGEAWRAGTPVISSIGVPAAATHPAACVLVPANDPSKISAAMIAATVDSAEQQRRVENGLAVAASLTWIGVAQSHVDVWKRL
jgi:glycosyltransferase involved in cell wall biosynthesis